MKIEYNEKFMGQACSNTHFPKTWSGRHYTSKYDIK
jgi:hypothetical protein